MKSKIIITALALILVAIYALVNIQSRGRDSGSESVNTPTAEDFVNCDELKLQVEVSIKNVADKYDGFNINTDSPDYPAIQKEINEHNYKIRDYYETCKDPDYAPIPLE